MDTLTDDSSSRSGASFHDVESPSAPSSVSSGTDSNSDHFTKSTVNSNHSDENNMVKKEENAVRKTRVFVGLAIVTCAVGIFVAVYFLSKQSDTRSFELEYEGFTADVMSLVQWEVRYNFALMEQLSSQVTIAAGLMNSSFPFHTEPQYEMTGGFVDGMGGIMSAAFAPLVSVNQREEWEKYSVENQGWIEESAYLKRVHPTHRDALHGTIQDHEHDRRLLHGNIQEHGNMHSHRRTQDEEEEPSISSFIYKYDEITGEKVPETNEQGKLFAPLWQVSPADAGAVNMNLLSDSRFVAIYNHMLETNGATILSQSTPIGDLFDFLFDPEEKIFKKDPHGLIIAPVYTKVEEKEDSVLAGITVAVTPYGNLLDRLLPKGKDGIIGVFNDNCGDLMSFELSSGKALFLGYQDAHEPEMEEYGKVLENIEMYGGFYGETSNDLCPHSLSLYPTQKLRDTYETTNTGIYVTIFGIAAALMAIFLFYDILVTKRQKKTMRNALRARAIVSSLFPERIAREMVDEPGGSNGGSLRKGSNHNKFDSFLIGDKTSSGQDGAAKRASKPLADLFPEATVMFGDLVGFTAWSSLREPHQVFTLLETIYASFDQIAAKKGVFKVETIGDCYVAVAGVPKPRDDHASVMASFASECCRSLPQVLKKLELELGPDTSTLGIRIGLHSGPVTAGVLRGERARFQLFGDTVNTTARIESLGEKNKVHLSEETANLLVAAGKDHWVTPREDKVAAKGKGELNTFWLRLKKNKNTSSPDSSAKDPDEEKQQSNKLRNIDSQNIDEERERFVKWVVDIMKLPLNELVGRRTALRTKSDPKEQLRRVEKEISRNEAMAINEVKEVIWLPKYYDAKTQGNAGSVSPDVLSQLHDYVRTVAWMYRKNPFHNFEHACHVLMSCSKLLSRIVSSDDENEAKVLHDHTYGITSDPLTQFSVILSALIHDLDHPGVPNAQLNKENDELAVLYRNKSAAEQHSFDAAWELLMEDSYGDLRAAIYCNKEELVRFRQLTVNAVMATDIMDKRLGAARKERWNKAFSDDIVPFDNRRPESEEEDRNRKATIVIEHIIQASDVAHTMQHWHIYKKWNQRLFRENYIAFKEGRAEKNPLDGWYQGEIGFFDFYIVPLARKLETCGVFGVSSDEYLNYALANRDEWVRKGQDVVKELEEIVRRDYS